MTRLAGQNAGMAENEAPPRGRLRERTAEEIRVLLARRRMSAAELARRTGLKQSTMARRMTGETAFDLDDLEVIATALGVKVSDLVNDGGGSVQTTVPKLQVTEQRPAGPTRPMATRPRDDRPKGRPGGQVPNPRTRRPARIPSGRSLQASAA